MVSIRRVDRRALTSARPCGTSVCGRELNVSTTTGHLIWPTPSMSGRPSPLDGLSGRAKASAKRLGLCTAKSSLSWPSAFGHTRGNPSTEMWQSTTARSTHDPSPRADCPAAARCHLGRQCGVWPRAGPAVIAPAPVLRGSADEIIRERALRRARKIAYDPAITLTMVTPSQGIGASALARRLLLRRQSQILFDAIGRGHAESRARGRRGRSFGASVLHVKPHLVVVDVSSGHGEPPLQGRLVHTRSTATTDRALRSKRTLPARRSSAGSGLRPSPPPLRLHSHPD